MKLPCEMVRDLLPLYHDGVCSAVSGTLVEEHLKECGDCREVLAEIRTDIQVPKLETEKAEPLVSINVSWNKQKRKMLIKCLCAGVMSFLLFLCGWWGLTYWRIVPFEKEDYVIRESLRFSNGYIYLHYSPMYQNSYPESYVTEEGMLYMSRRHAVLAERMESPTTGSVGIYFLPGTETRVTEEGKEVVITAVYLGQPHSKDAVLLWKTGMDVPLVTPEEEHNYKDLMKVESRLESLIKRYKEAEENEMEQTAEGE